MRSMPKVLATVAVIVLLLEGSVTYCHTPVGSADVGAYELSADTRPEVYHLHLHTDIHEEEANLKFSARVKIHTRVVEATASIVLRSLDLNITHITLADANGEVIREGVNHVVDNERETLTVTFDDELEKDQVYELDISYEGAFPAAFVGSFDGEEETKSHYLAASFQSINFRTICPCDDEYGIRSIFQIEIEHHDLFNAVFNTEIHLRQEPDENGFTTTTFEPTRALPTTSLAFFVSNLKPTSVEEPEIDIYGEVTDFYQHALEVAKDAVELAQTLFNSELTALKLIALPSTVTTISTPGLIFLNQHKIIYRSEVETTAAQKDKILRVITRVVANQYFGNVVAMKEWRESFLTDGLAVLFGNLMAERLEDDEEISKLHSFDISHVALEIDSLNTVNSLEAIREKNIEEISEFSSRKAASILKMFASVHGEEKFIEAACGFLEKYKFELATVLDFTSELEDTDFDASSLKVWLQNPGYPLVTVTRMCANIIRVVQERFFSYDLECGSCSQLWSIPLTFINKSGERSSEVIWLSEPTMLVEVESDWMVINADGNGYYRVNYDDSTWTEITAVLRDEGNFKKIPVMNRVRLISDAASLAFAGKLSYQTLFSLLTYVKHEDELVVWKTAAETFEFLDTMLFSDEALYENFLMLITEIITPAYEKYGLEVIEDESSAVREMRKIAVYWACKVGIESCVNFVADHFAESFEDIQPEVRSIVLCSGLRTASKETFNATIDKMLESDSKEELIYALACTEDLESLINLILLIKTQNSLSACDKRLIFTSAVENYRYGAKAAIDLINRYLTALSQAETDFMLQQLPKRMWDSGWLFDFNRTLSSLKTDVKISIDESEIYYSMTDITANWLISNREELSSWFEIYLRESATTTTLSSTTSSEETTTIETTTPDGGVRVSVGVLSTLVIGLCTIF